MASMSNSAVHRRRSGSPRPPRRQLRRTQPVPSWTRWFWWIRTGRRNVFLVQEQAGGAGGAVRVVIGIYKHRLVPGAGLDQAVRRLVEVSHEGGTGKVPQASGKEAFGLTVGGDSPVGQDPRRRRRESRPRAQFFHEQRGRCPKRPFPREMPLHPLPFHLDHLLPAPQCDDRAGHEDGGIGPHDHPIVRAARIPAGRCRRRRAARRR